MCTVHGPFKHTRSLLEEMYESLTCYCFLYKTILKYGEIDIACYTYHFHYFLPKNVTSFVIRGGWGVPTFGIC